MDEALERNRKKNRIRNSTLDRSTHFTHHETHESYKIYTFLYAKEHLALTEIFWRIHYTKSAHSRPVDHSRRDKEEREHKEGLGVRHVLLRYRGGKAIAEALIA